MYLKNVRGVSQVLNEAEHVNPAPPALIATDLPQQCTLKENNYLWFSGGVGLGLPERMSEKKAPSKSTGKKLERAVCKCCVHLWAEATDI